MQMRFAPIAVFQLALPVLPTYYNNELLEKFRHAPCTLQLHGVYAQECMETTGGYCLYTDVMYGTCSLAEASELAP